MSKLTKKEQKIYSRLRGGTITVMQGFAIGNTNTGERLIGTLEIKLVLKLRELGLIEAVNSASENLYRVIDTTPDPEPPTPVINSCKANEGHEDIATCVYYPVDVQLWDALANHMNAGQYPELSFELQTIIKAPKEYYSDELRTLCKELLAELSRELQWAYRFPSPMTEFVIELRKAAHEDMAAVREWLKEGSATVAQAEPVPVAEIAIVEKPIFHIGDKVTFKNKTYKVIDLKVLGFIGIQFAEDRQGEKGKPPIFYRPTDELALVQEKAKAA